MCDIIEIFYCTQISTLNIFFKVIYTIDLSNVLPSVNFHDFFLHLIYLFAGVEKKFHSVATVLGSFQKVMDQKSIKLCVWNTMIRNLFPSTTSPNTRWCRGHLKHALNVYDIVRCYDEKTEISVLAAP